jgi:transposase
VSRVFGLDVHRDFAEVAVVEDGLLRRVGRIGTSPDELALFAASLLPTDRLALEATINTFAIARLLEASGARVVVSNPMKTRAIAEAKVKTDKVDAAVLAQLLAADFLPAVWRPDEQLEALRRLVAQRTRIVRERTRLKNHVQAVLYRNLVPRCPYKDLFGRSGRAWLAARPLPADERIAVDSTLRRLDVAGEELRLVEGELARRALANDDARRLMTIPGVDFAVAISLIAAIGEIGRFPSSRKLTSYLGLDPNVRQSGLQPARHGRISKKGRAQARGMLIEAAWACAKTPGPLRAFYQRVRARRGAQIAAVACARKLAVLCWQMLTRGEDYAFARPLLTAQKLRALELRAGAPQRRGQRGPTWAYSVRELRERERALSEQAELAYSKLTAGWQRQRPAAGAGAATGERL